MPFVVGETIGPYQLLGQLGQGGMATVFKAYHAALDRFVAIKALHPAFMVDANFLARFQREARLVAKLDHPAIVPVYDFAEHEGRPFLVMKFIEGDTLKAALLRANLDHRPMGADEIARIAEAVGAGLAYAHRQGILHRDIKPSNVLITPSGQIYLADFGLARIAASSGSTLTADMLIGTPQYISPEQALSKTDLDARTDIYSFGVMLYEMVVGRVPFQGDTPYAIIHDHIYTPLPLPSVLNPAVPENVERVLLKALAKERAERYVSVDEMVAEFNHALRSEFPPAETVLAVLPDLPATLQSVPPAVPEPGVDLVDRTTVDRTVTGAPGVIDLSGAPSYTPPDLEPFSPNGIPLAVEPAAVSAVSPAGTAKKKKGLPVWAVIGLVVVVLLLCGGLWVVGRGLGRGASGAFLTATANSLAAVAVTPAVAALVTPAAATVTAGAVTRPPVPPDAWNTAMEALALWQNHNFVAADTLFTRAVRQAGDSPAFFNQAGDKLAASQAWVPAALMYANLSRVEGSSLSAEQFDHLRQALFLAAKEPQARPLFSKSQTIPFYLVDEARFDLYQGDQGKAKTLLDGVMANPEDVAKYPEASLVQAELLLKNGKTAQAVGNINDLLKQPVLSGWITTAARAILAQAGQPK